MKKILIATLLVVLAAVEVRADSFEITVTAAYLRYANGDLMPLTGLAMLVASTLDSVFAGPTPTAFVQGDDIIIKKWDLSVAETPGLLFDTTGSVYLEGDLNTGDPLALYWFPTLTLSSTAPGWGTQYGFFTTNVAVDGGIPWATPGAGHSSDLYLLTESAGGSLPEDAGKALFSTVIPEPSVGMLIGMGLVGFLMIRRRSGRK